MYSNLNCKCTSVQVYEIPKCSWYINWKLSKYTTIKYGQQVHRNVDTAKTGTLFQEHDRTNQKPLAFVKQNWTDLFLKITPCYRDQERQEKKQVPSRDQILNKIQRKCSLSDLLLPLTILLSPVRWGVWGVFLLVRNIVEEFYNKMKQ